MENIIFSDADIWKEYDLSGAGCAHWKIGPLKLWVCSLEREFDLLYKYSSDHEDRDVQTQIPYLGPMPEEGESVRYGIRNRCNKIIFAPAMPNRSVIVRPEKPFFVLEHDVSTLYVTTGLWLHATCRDLNKTIFTIPIVRLKGTWFGDDPTSGEICYAAKTKGQLKFNEVLVYHYRFMTKIKIINNTGVPLKLERVKLAIPYLNLYKNQNNFFVTDHVTIKKDRENKDIHVWFERPKDEDFGPLQLVMASQKKHEKGIFEKTLAQIIG
ncbi:MAG: hypothetical protein A2504_00070 [Bdellovibrionales bacterium RIFOXYD12_FULL_39_22]|nr:MAG: hypothetical protein A2385_14955 [Bdellovibrionales bacterium RIFOXYB1_FULL_39_21]OFZ43740.1 MAG: hypothetical protein A2485_07780 [Bdellovibrionales bacterium RIFOXYC12_FULL_39_17]OFZ48089.1 MAG: hypothetical protein A2404_15710 [Bdellovibrionales bacterium RIFOXYC1_FULL_39_130]OFZ73775.1 MAG: hypothetical protein A2451_13575 [Bdellovibrionales bacterium RIFOXYC2_FULL_39_8]OFZ77248.1 MAG: hypothetical protein A2560_08275 [Bdellovibrionales bacterium RIFOXYD1_FULL_39_84]OFZ95692.1 MAG: